MSFYHDGHRTLQSRFSSTALADRLEQVTLGSTLSDADAQFVGSASFFFLATADQQGRPECSYKGGAPGFVRVLSPDLLVFPDYDGNGMFRSLGNLQVNPALAMLFIAMDASPKRLRINGQARVAFDDDALMAEFPGAQALIRVTPDHVFPNCPRYIHDATAGELSPYTPAPGGLVAEPAWKSFDDFKDVVPPRKA